MQRPDESEIVRYDSIIMIADTMIGRADRRYLRNARCFRSNGEVLPRIFQAEGGRFRPISPDPGPMAAFHIL